MRDVDREAASGSARVGDSVQPALEICPVPRWTLADYQRECKGPYDETLSRAMATDGRNLLIYDRNCHERDTALGTWQRRWNVLMRWCVGMLIDVMHADMPFVSCEQELLYCRRSYYIVAGLANYWLVMRLFV